MPPKGKRAVRHCAKRPVAHRGRRFKQADCRVWMRLMFRAARVEGLSAAFGAWFRAWTRHFIQIYERSAGVFVEV